MSTYLPKNKNYKLFLKYLIISISLIALTLIYEIFSHGVTSIYMRLAFLFPLIGGSALSLLLPRIIKPNKFSSAFWKMGLTTYVVGFFLLGIFEIYGSIEPTVYIYLYLGGVLLALSIINYLVYSIMSKIKNKKQGD